MMYGRVKAYKNIKFLKPREAQPMHTLSEYLEPENRFEGFDVSYTIVFFGSVWAHSREDAHTALKAAKATSLINLTDMEKWVLDTSHYY
jgi:hypothetical protein